MKATASPAAGHDSQAPGRSEGLGSGQPRRAAGGEGPAISEDEAALLFWFFNEILCVAHLSGRVLEAGLPDGFLVSHFSVLDHLMRFGDGPTPLALARAFHVPKTTMTHTLAGLEKAGLIHFAPNPEDGRSKCVMLTDEGRRFRDAAIEDLQPEFAVLAERFPADDIARAARQLAGIREHLEQRQGY